MFYRTPLHHTLFGAALFLLAGFGVSYYVEVLAPDAQRDAFHARVEELSQAHATRSREERRLNPVGGAARIYNEMIRGYFAE